MTTRKGGTLGRYELLFESYSMQAVPPEVRKCAVFLGFRFKDKKGVEHGALAGTAFFVSVPLEGFDRAMIYLVTARHVIAKIAEHTVDNIVSVRINRHKGSAVPIGTKLSDWKFHPNDSSVDAAVIQLTPDPKVCDFRALAIKMAVTDETIKKEQIGEGDEVFLTGLFHYHFGDEKNLPIIRTGNIALMPEEKVNVKGFGDIEAYLVEARSIKGLSGSPVFAYLGHTRAKNDNLTVGQDPLFTWLGVMHGHWDAPKNDIDTVDEAGKGVNVGIGIVVPAEKVVEIINQEHFAKQRGEAVKELKSANLPVEDSNGQAPKT